MFLTESIERLFIFKSTSNPLARDSNKKLEKDMSYYHKGFSCMEFDNRIDYSVGIGERANKTMRK